MGKPPISWRRKWAEIEKEFGLPPRMLVQNWRSNATYRTIAKALGVSARTLRRWRGYWGLEIHPAPYGPDRVRDEFSRKEAVVDTRALGLGYPSAAEYIRHQKMVNATDSEIAEALQCCTMTIWRHKPSEVRGIQNLSPAGREKLRECGRMSKGRHQPRDHPWR